MNLVDLENLELKIFTEQNASDYCQLNNIIIIYLNINKLTDISILNQLNKNIKII